MCLLPPSHDTLHMAHTLNVGDKNGWKLMKTLHGYETDIVAIVDGALRPEGS